MTRCKTGFARLTLALVGLMMFAQSSRAASVAFTIDNATGQTLGNPPFTLGFNFTANSPITVTKLGLFDSGQNGLFERHAVGLWNNSGILLASASVAQGTTDPLINQFRYASIAPIALAPGTYQVGALYLTGVDALIFPGNAINFQTHPSITFLNSAFASGATLNRPVGSVGTDPAYFGPNLAFAVVPTPSAVAGGTLLLGAGLVGVARRRWKLESSAAE
jgi:hypothetical protein